MEWVHYSLDLSKEWGHCYAFESAIYNGGETKCWVIKKYLFDTWMTPILLYEHEVCCGSICNSTWTKLEIFQKHSLMKFIWKSRDKCLKSLLFLEIGLLPTKAMALNHDPFKTWCASWLNPTKFIAYDGMHGKG